MPPGASQVTPFLAGKVLPPATHGAKGEAAERRRTTVGQGRARRACCRLAASSPVEDHLQTGYSQAVLLFTD
jgi:hypothetical protein